jgi:hypothetical protein
MKYEPIPPSAIPPAIRQLFAAGMPLTPVDEAEEGLDVTLAQTATVESRSTLDGIEVTYLDF